MESRVGGDTMFSVLAPPHVGGQVGPRECAMRSLKRFGLLVCLVSSVGGCVITDQASSFEGCVASTLQSGDPGRTTFVDCEVRRPAWVIAVPAHVRAEDLEAAGVPREIALMVATGHNSGGRWCVGEPTGPTGRDAVRVGARYTVECVSSNVRIRTTAASYGSLFRIQLDRVQGTTREVQQLSQLRKKP